LTTKKKYNDHNLRSRTTTKLMAIIINNENQNDQSYIGAKSTQNNSPRNAMAILVNLAPMYDRSLFIVIYINIGQFSQFTRLVKIQHGTGSQSHYYVHFYQVNQQKKSLYGILGTFRLVLTIINSNYDYFA